MDLNLLIFYLRVMVQDEETYTRQNLFVRDELHNREGSDL